MKGETQLSVAPFLCKRNSLVYWQKFSIIWHLYLFNRIIVYLLTYLLVRFSQYRHSTLLKSEYSVFVIVSDANIFMHKPYARAKAIFHILFWKNFPCFNPQTFFCSRAFLSFAIIAHVCYLKNFNCMGVPSSVSMNIFLKMWKRTSNSLMVPFLVQNCHDSNRNAVAGAEDVGKALLWLPCHAVIPHQPQSFDDPHH